MDCQDAKEKLLESLEGALSADGKRQLERHLIACPNCAEFGELLAGQEMVGSMEPGGLALLLRDCDFVGELGCLHFAFPPRNL